MSSFMKIHFWSDIHSEFLKTDIEQFLDIKGDVLVLAGDIGDPSSERYKQFITRLSNNFNQIFLIAGNHEYYQDLDQLLFTLEFDQVKTMIEVENEMNIFCKSLPNVKFLQKETYMYRDVLFMGCTLWSSCNTSDTSLTKYINDFRKIPNMSFEKFNKLHTDHSEWLRNKLSESKDIKKIVITHHIPTFKLMDKKYKDHPLNSFFYSELDFINKADFWICGHSHTANSIKINNCLCVLNPLGYPVEKGTTRFDINKVLVIE
jgi:predicted phosphodiesterase